MVGGETCTEILRTREMMLGSDSYGGVEVTAQVPKEREIEATTKQAATPRRYLCRHDNPSEQTVFTIHGLQSSLLDISTGMIVRWKPPCSTHDLGLGVPSVYIESQDMSTIGHWLIGPIISHCYLKDSNTYWNKTGT